jgi:HPP family
LLKPTEIAWATLGETGLILVVTVIVLVTRQPLIFASLGPTAYELVEQPHQKSARLYNVIVGHLIGLACGFLSILFAHVSAEPDALATGILTTSRLVAIVPSVALTTLLTLVASAGQPAALATTLLISLGSIEKLRDAMAIIAGVLLIAAIGEPVRRFRLNQLASRKRFSQ